MVSENEVAQLFPDSADKLATGSTESELALILQEAQPGDARLLDLLIEPYAAEVHWLVQVLLAATGYGRERLPGDAQQSTRAKPVKPVAGSAQAILHNQATAVVQQTFTSAVANVDEFWGEASVRNWLLKIAIKLVQKNRRLDKLRRFFGRQGSVAPEIHFEPARQPASHPPETGFASHVRRKVFNRLPVREKLPVILRYLVGLELDDIAQVLETSRASVHRLLTSARARFLASEKGQPGKQARLHTRFCRQIEAALDQLLVDQDPARDVLLLDHLAACQDCQDHAARLKALEEALSADLRGRWPLPQFDPDELNTLAETAYRGLDRPPVMKYYWLPVWKGAWFAVLMLFFIAGAWAVYRALPEEESPPASAAPTLPPLPQPLEFEVASISPARAAGASGSHEVAISIEPDLSHNGRWIVFTSTAASLTQGEANGLPGVYLYDRHTQVFERLDVHHSDAPVYVWSRTPNISADGRLVVFSSTLTSPQGSGDFQVGSAGIWLYDRWTRQTERISLGHDGSPADGDSYFPVLSADGRWVAFWSLATNLVSNDPGACTWVGNHFACLDLFIHDRENGVTRSLSIRRTLSESAGPKQISLSADGRWIGVAILSSDLIAKKLEVKNESEAFVYDRETGEWMRLNQAEDGAPGDGSSYAPRLSADGGTAAFVTLASNLVPGDTNGAADVFVRDLQSGLIKRVSTASDGAQGNADSGLTRLRWRIWGEDVDLSADGRYVVFTSLASNLVEGSLKICSTGSERNCNNIYVHDLETGRTEGLEIAQKDHYFRFISISGNGRWVGFTETKADCSPAEQAACDEVWLHDRETGWTSSVTKGKSALLLAEPLPWESAFRLSGHKRDVTALAFSPDGKWLATGSFDATVRLWQDFKDDAAGMLLAGNPAKTVTALAFSPDGHYLAAGAFDGSVTVWLLHQPVPQVIYRLFDHPGRIASLAFSSDGSRLMAATPQSVWIWERKERSFSRVVSLDYPQKFVGDVDFSPDGEWLAIAADDNTVWLQQVATGEVPLRLGGHQGKIVTLAFSPDGQYLASGSRDRMVNLWQVDTKDPEGVEATYLKTLPHGSQLKQVAFSGSAAMLATVDISGLLQLWAVPGGDPLAGPQLDGDVRVRTAEFSPGGDILAAAVSGFAVNLWQNVVNIESPRFFIRVENLEESPTVAALAAFREANAGLRGLNARLSGEVMTLYQANATVSFELQAPLVLPLGGAFQGVHHTFDGAVILNYRFSDTPDGDPAAWLSICQTTRTSEQRSCGMQVGANAVVERVVIGNQWAEHVRGDWVQRMSPSQLGGAAPGVEFSWQSQAPAQRLRWQSGNQVISIYSWPSSNGRIYTSKADLVAIAESMVPIDRQPDQNQVLITYRVKEGDTCTAIASYFGTTVDALIRLNILTDRCDLIYAGQDLVIPLPNRRVPVGEYDLNCDGRLERLQFIPVPGAPFPGDLFGITVERPDRTGLYKEAWRYTIAETGATLFKNPAMFKVGDCERFLAFNSISADPNEAGMKVFRWDGERMVLALAADGYAQGSLIPEGPLAVIKAHKLVREPGSNTCRRVVTHYGWDGNAYIEVAKTEEGGIACQGEHDFIAPASQTGGLKLDFLSPINMR